MQRDHPACQWVDHEIAGKYLNSVLLDQFLVLVRINLHRDEPTAEHLFNRDIRKNFAVHPFAGHAPVGIKVDEQRQFLLFRFLHRQFEIGSKDLGIRTHQPRGCRYRKDRESNEQKRQTTRRGITTEIPAD